MTRNIDVFNRGDFEQKREMLITYFSRCASVCYSDLYSLCSDSMSYDEFVECGKDQVAKFVDEFLEWLFAPKEVS